MRRPLFAGVALLAGLLLAVEGRTYVHGLTLVVRAADLHGPVRRVADADTVQISERLIRARIGDSWMNLRVYTPAVRPHQTVLLVSGLHPAGIDEPRLIGLARRLAPKANLRLVGPVKRLESRGVRTPAFSTLLRRVSSVSVR